jgi:hypothetical protein
MSWLWEGIRRSALQFAAPCSVCAKAAATYCRIIGRTELKFMFQRSPQVENQSYQCRGRASSLLVQHSPSKCSSTQVNEVQNQQLLYSSQGGRRDEYSSKSSRTALHYFMKREKQNQRPRMALALDIVSEGKRKPAPFYSGTRQLC